MQLLSCLGRLVHSSSPRVCGAAAALNALLQCRCARDDARAAARPQGFKEVTAQEAHDLRQADSAVFLLDVRTREVRRSLTLNPITLGRCRPPPRPIPEQCSPPRGAPVSVTRPHSASRAWFRYCRGDS